MTEKEHKEKWDGKVYVSPALNLHRMGLMPLTKEEWDAEIATIEKASKERDVRYGKEDV